MQDLKSFKEQMISKMWEFETEWMENHKKNEELFPLTMNQDDWDDQFYTWLSLDGVCIYKKMEFVESLLKLDWLLQITEYNKMKDWKYDAVGIGLYLMYLNHKLQDYKATEDKVKRLYSIEEKKYESKLLNKLFRFKYKDSSACVFDNWAMYSSKMQEIESEITRTEYKKSIGYGYIVPSTCISAGDFYAWVSLNKTKGSEQ